MIETVKHGTRSGRIAIPASKSAAHRQLICSALSGEKSRVVCGGMSEDIRATIRCLNALGADIRDEGGSTLSVIPCGTPDASERHLRPGESGSTLRFLLPVVTALGANAVFHMEGKLPARPHELLTSQLRDHGAAVVQDGELMSCSGKLRPGVFETPGNVSSQFISGLLFALPLLDGDSELRVTGSIESAAYITMTEQAIAGAGIKFTKTGNSYLIPGRQTYKAAKKVLVESDWSNAAFFLCMGATSGKGILVEGPDASSAQGDKAVIDILKRFGADVTEGNRSFLVKKGDLHPVEIDASGIPDLVPVLSVLACAAEGKTVITGAARLRFKESDRLKTTAALITSLGGTVEETDDGLVIYGKGQLDGGTVDSFNDHRIAMSAAVAASICGNDVTVNDAGCVAKSYPGFWKDLGTMEEN